MWLTRASEPSSPGQLGARSLSRLPSLGGGWKNPDLPAPETLSFPSIVQGMTRDQGYG